MNLRANSSRTQFGDPNRLLVTLGLALIAALVFVWPLPHTIALRNGLLFFGLALFGWLLFRQKLAWHIPPSLHLPLAIYLALSCWLVFVALVVSEETSWSLGELKGQWLKGALAMALGGMVAMTSNLLRGMSRPLTAAIIVLALATQVLIVDVTALVLWIQGGVFPRRVSGIMEHSAYANHVTNLLLAFLLADIFLRLTRSTSKLRLSNLTIVLLVLAGLVSAAFEYMRNGLIELSFSLLLLLSMLWYENRARIPTFRLAAQMVLVLLILGGFAYFDLRNNFHWRTFWETVPVALDTKSHTAWLDPKFAPLPKLPDGTEVSHSNYMRIAWIKEGAILVAENPLGIGYGRNAFSHALTAKYGPNGAGSSHSGLLDLAIGAGIPGAFIWCGFLCALVWLAARRYRASRDYFALTQILVVSGFGIRMLLDANIRDHVLEQFLFVVGLLAVWIATAATPGAVNPIDQRV